MRLLLLAVGRLKVGPERELYDRYLKRARAGGRAVGVTDIGDIEIDESRARAADVRRREEGEGLLARMPPGADLVSLDERGRSLTTAQWAALLSGHRDRGSGLCFAVGGPDGLSPEIRERGEVLAFGMATFPHQLVRVLLAEQIYRVTTVLAGHPYHRD